MATVGLTLMERKLDLRRTGLYKPFWILFWGSIGTIVIGMFYSGNEIIMYLLATLVILLVLIAVVMLGLALVRYLLDLKLIISVK